MGVIADKDVIKIVIKKIISILSLNFSIKTPFKKDMEGLSPPFFQSVSKY
tara:strand:- start:421 stop:570 length:150 start_codon:yes stop_codon:yes gene_type:complete